MYHLPKKQYLIPGEIETNERGVFFGSFDQTLIKKTLFTHNLPHYTNVTCTISAGSDSRLPYCTEINTRLSSLALAVSPKWAE